MKVSELILELQKQPQDMDVVCNIYEGGNGDVESVGIEVYISPVNGKKHEYVLINK